MASINPVAQVAQQILLGGAVKQNHALEHATIVLLSQKYPNVRLAGTRVSIRAPRTRRRYHACSVRSAPVVCG